MLPLRTILGLFLVLSVFSLSSFPVLAQKKPLSEIFPAEKWEEIDSRVDRALRWIHQQQQADGSFHTPTPRGQPAVTSFSIMAFLSRGHVPGRGPYGESLDHAINFALNCQQGDGYFSMEEFVPGHHHQRRRPPGTPSEISHSAAYNHAITTLMLAEVYGMISDDRSAKIKVALERALKFSYLLQDRKKPRAIDEGGWRYLHHHHDQRDSDLSVTGWYLMALRAAKNAGFPVPKERIDRVVTYVRRCYRQGDQQFNYIIDNYQEKPPMTGAGALCLALSGKHDDPFLRGAAESLERIDYFFELNRRSERHKFAMYGCYYCSQAAAQIGGRVLATYLSQNL